MSSSTISAIVIAVEFVLRAVCVYAILRVTLTLFSIRKAEKLEKERDAALAWLKYSCDDCESCTHADDIRNCDIDAFQEDGTCPTWCVRDCKCKTCKDASNWTFCGKFPDEVLNDDDGKNS